MAAPTTRARPDERSTIQFELIMGDFNIGADRAE
jgi:hypothetical protein